MRKLIFSGILGVFLASNIQASFFNKLAEKFFNCYTGCNAFNGKGHGDDFVKNIISDTAKKCLKCGYQPNYLSAFWQAILEEPNETTAKDVYKNLGLIIDAIKESREYQNQIKDWYSTARDEFESIEKMIRAKLIYLAKFSELVEAFNETNFKSSEEAVEAMAALNEFAAMGQSNKVGFVKINENTTEDDIRFQIDLLEDVFNEWHEAAETAKFRTYTLFAVISRI